MAEGLGKYIQIYWHVRVTCNVKQGQELVFAIGTM